MVLLWNSFSVLDPSNNTTKRVFQFLEGTNNTLQRQMLLGVEAISDLWWSVCKYLQPINEAQQQWTKHVPVVFTASTTMIILHRFVQRLETSSYKNARPCKNTLHQMDPAGVLQDPGIHHTLTPEWSSRKLNAPYNFIFLLLWIINMEESPVATRVKY